jgi:8-oxo-dGTP pyrophosphatase MutT (NUDIX family)
MIIQLDEIKKNLTSIDTGEKSIALPVPGHWSNPEPAAVLIPLVKEDERWNLLFIKRTHHPEDRHSGQIAFPGGRADITDQTLLKTALRETREEIGIDPEDVEILGLSRQISTVTNYRISPFVGIIPWPYRLKLSQEEVEKAFLIPLDWLNDPSHHHVKAWRSSSRPQDDLEVIFFEEYDSEVLWGATAQIVVDFLQLILGVS